MIEDERLEQLLRSSLPPAAASGPSRDLWPLIVSRSQTPAGWRRLDISIAAVAIIVLLMFPDWLWLVVYHL